MSINVGIPNNFSCIFSLNSHFFININEKRNNIICILDHSVTRMCLPIISKPGLVL